MISFLVYKLGLQIFEIYYDFAISPQIHDVKTLFSKVLENFYYYLELLRVSAS